MQNKKELLERLKEERPAMEVRDLSFAYGKNQILKDISLMISMGKITTIMGANGCGKSTLFSLMTKNLDPDRGKIFLYGKNIKNLKLNEFARKVSIVHQYNQAADDITVERLIAYGRTPYMKLMGGKSEEDEELIRRPLPSFQRGKEKVEHIRAEGVEPFHPITPFSLSQRRSRE